MIVASWIAAVCFLAILLALPRYLTWRRIQLENMIELREQFFKSATALLQQGDDTPKIVIERLSMASFCMDHPALGRYVMWRAITGKLRNDAENPPKALKEFHDAVSQMRPELRTLVWKSLTSAVLAATYTNVFVGLVLRRLIFFSVQRNQEQAEIVVGSMTPSDNHHPHALAA